jgi:hypothetical protein
VRHAQALSPHHLPSPCSLTRVFFQVLQISPEMEAELASLESASPSASSPLQQLPPELLRQIWRGLGHDPSNSLIDVCIDTRWPCMRGGQGCPPLLAPAGGAASVVGGQRGGPPSIPSLPFLSVTMPHACGGSGDATRAVPRGGQWAGMGSAVGRNAAMLRIGLLGALTAHGMPPETAKTSRFPLLPLPSSPPDQPLPRTPASCQIPARTALLSLSS